MKRIRRMLRRRHSVLFDALIAIASAIIIVTVLHMIAWAIYGADRPAKLERAAAAAKPDRDPMEETLGIVLAIGLAFIWVVQGFR
jgi:hypothetical protein